jgi:hypothetical protein
MSGYTRKERCFFDSSPLVVRRSRRLRLSRGWPAAASSLSGRVSLYWLLSVVIQEVSDARCVDQRS